MPAIETEYNEIEDLSVWDFYNTKQIPDGYDHKTIPEATPENMVIMMEKINELTKAVNQLTMINSHLLKCRKK